jgi:NAD(P)-dependent dehydrogenase (short-subunit alcohol dehydrogenase family)
MIGSGIGRAVALLYVRDGVDGITIADFNGESLNETERLIKEISASVKVIAVVADVSDPTSVNDMVESACVLGPINYAANVAGVSRCCTFISMYRMLMRSLGLAQKGIDLFDRAFGRLRQCPES